MTSVKHPWQSGPTELIQYGIEHLHRSNDFDQRIAYLLFDVGVETLFKTYLTLPDEVTKTKMRFFERKQAAEGNFHDLVRAVGKAAGDNLKNFNLTHIQFYHDLRNKLYHEGNGITIPTEKVHQYAELATSLLLALLNVDLSAELLKPELEAKEFAKILELREVLKSKRDLLRNGFSSLDRHLMLVLEKTVPKFTMPSFYNRFTEITNKYLVKYVADVDDDGSPIYSKKMTEKKEPVHRFQREIVNFLESLIDDQKLKRTLFELESFTFFDTEKEIESVLLPIVYSGYPEAKSIQYRTLELVLPEFERWFLVVKQDDMPDYSLVDPRLDEVERLSKAITNVDSLLKEIDIVQAEIKDWLANH